MLHGVHGSVYYKMNWVLLASLYHQCGIWKYGFCFFSVHYVICLLQLLISMYVGQILLQPRGGLGRVRNLSHLIFAGKFN